MPNTIVLAGQVEYKEELAAEAITPGMLLEFVPSGADAGQVRKHSTKGGLTQSMFAVEASQIGREIGTAYADGETCNYVVAHKGAEINALLGPSESVDAGQFLVSKGDGSLKRRTTENIGIVAQAIESVNNIAGTANKRLRVEAV